MFWNVTIRHFLGGVKTLIQPMTFGKNERSVPLLHVTGVSAGDVSECGAELRITAKLKL